MSADDLCSVQECHFNTSNYKISCPKPGCNWSFCLNCWEKWYPKQVREFRCPDCNSEMPILATVQNNKVPKNFMKDRMLPRLANGLYFREVARYEQLIPEIKATCERKEIRSQINDLHFDWNCKRKRHRNLLLIQKNPETSKEELNRVNQCIEAIQAEFAKINTRLAELNQLLSRVQNGGEGTSGSHKESEQFIIHCPTRECNGRIGSHSWKCTVCDVVVCSKCREVCDEDHVCDPDTLATIEAAQNGTKPCPTCGIAIEKVSGCDQMWCKSCHDRLGRGLWDWKTGKELNIETTPIHNPHFLERRTEMRLQHQLCRRNSVSEEQMRIRFEEPSAGPQVDVQAVYNVQPVLPVHIIHGFGYIIRHDNRYRREYEDGELRNLMMLYYKNSITENEWKKILKRFVKKKIRNQELVPVFENYMQCIHEMSWLYITGNFTTHEFYTQYLELRAITIQQFEVIEKIFNLKSPTLDEYGRLSHLRH